MSKWTERATALSFLGTGERGALSADSLCAMTLSFGWPCGKRPGAVRTERQVLGCAQDLGSSFLLWLDSHLTWCLCCHVTPFTPEFDLLRVSFRWLFGRGTKSRKDSPVTSWWICEKSGCFAHCALDEEARFHLPSVVPLPAPLSWLRADKKGDTYHCSGD